MVKFIKVFCKKTVLCCIQNNSAFQITRNELHTLAQDHCTGKKILLFL